MSDEEIKKTPLAAIREAFPFPWQGMHMIQPGIGGLFKIMDSAGKEVSIQAIVDFVVLMSNHIESQKQGKAA